ncbi:MAG TPA: ankyrin repeat domain-containing protein [Leptospiraceae bacterium]|nr:ankyrin repeat domain-containing protein [Leptospiraceae bacterium]HMW05113.1 ankyrin repeat domain-containing protein [Leptospiraceae bacterium]HMX31367.1 ankyrin repeat domain-containing protein [Leptospiraceae bacterium]HMY31590.1 ankyrin repeat domain-containing protein [Leptospiraceae bacterium]HMZ66857.1 ankyrin repeat domain-containing protein [Leptospiraceae bacterium]
MKLNQFSFKILFSVLIQILWMTSALIADASFDLIQGVKNRKLNQVSNALNMNADPNIKVNGNRPILLIAAENGDFEIIQMLLAKGAQVNSFETTKENPGWTALMHSTENGRMDIIRLLLAKGANKKQKNGKGYDAIYLAKLWGNSEVAAFLEGRDINEKKLQPCGKILTEKNLNQKNISLVDLKNNKFYKKSFLSRST